MECGLWTERGSIVWARREVGADGTAVWLGRSLESKCLRRSGLRTPEMQASVVRRAKGAKWK